MYKFILFFLLPFCFHYSLKAQQSKEIKVDRKLKNISIQQTGIDSFNFQLKKNIYYSIIVEQNGIDVKISLKGKNEKLISEKDSPNGKFGPERLDYSPDSNSVFTLLVSPLADPENSKQGLYNVIIKQVPKNLAVFNYKELIEDFELLKNGFIETRVGLWYNSYTEFNNLCNLQKSKIKDKMTALEFYQIIAPVVAFTKEGHCIIRNSDETASYFKQNGRFFPFIVKILDNKVYITNDFENFKTKGLQISKINQTPIEEILNRFLSIEPADGYNITSKHRWIENSFSRYYAYFFEQSPKSFTIELTNPKTNEKIVVNNIKSLDFKNWAIKSKEYKAAIINYGFKEPITFKIDTARNIATLTVNDMGLDSYKDGRKEFKNFLENSFKSIADLKVQNLIIDIRKNEGGEQGMEDHLMSYLMPKDSVYKKYNYVEVPSFTYSFTKYTDYKNDPHNLDRELREWFFQSTDGRITNIAGLYKNDKPKSNSFKGNLYILIGGLTFSGGSEFAALAKNHTNAIFIGEETGGGYYGNTSGKFLLFTLPNTNLTGRIPLQKYVVYTKNNSVLFGHGLTPDYFVSPKIENYLNGVDEEMEFTKNRIEKKQ